MKEEKLNSINPTGSIFVDYKPESRNLLPDGEEVVFLTNSKSERITIFRGVPKGVQEEIVSGDYVTTNPETAKIYAGAGGEVIKAEVLAMHLVVDTDEIAEGWEVATEECIYINREDLEKPPQS